MKYVLVNDSCGVLTAMKTVYDNIEKAEQTAKRVNHRGYGKYEIYQLIKL